MKIFKFGGASVKDAESVKNVASIIKTEGAKDTLVVISAMGKMTNAFEDIVDAYYHKLEELPEKLTYQKMGDTSQLEIMAQEIERKFKN